MKVSVLIVVYNQERYIRQTIASVLMQDVNFDYEIVIGEDASTDDTRKIVLELEQQHPERIRVLLRDATDAARDRAAGLGGKSNFVQGLYACRGEYVALLDGDDYWTDPLKLQKQVDFLDNNPDFAMSCHNVAMLYEDGSKELENLFPSGQKEIASLEDLLFGNFIQSCTVVFRRGLFADFPEWFYTLKIGDWPVHIFNAERGLIKYFPESMAVYRVHEKGFWSGWTSVDRGLEVIKMLGHIDAHLGFKYRKQIRASQANCFWDIGQQCYRENRQREGRTYLGKYLSFAGTRSYRNLLSFYLQLKTPAIYQGLKACKDFISSGNSHPRAIGS